MNKFVNVVFKLFDLIVHFVACIIIIVILYHYNSFFMPLINVLIKNLL